MKIEQEEPRYTYEEILDMFMKDETLDVNFQNEIRGRLDAFYQSMYDCVHSKNDRMKHLIPPFGDSWVEENNRIITIYQRYESRRGL